MSTAPPSDHRSRPGLTPQARAEQEARLEREAAALRENLRRRKEQQHARSVAQKEPDAAK